jgi:hypothetical protein
MTSSLYPSTGNYNVKSICLQHKVARASLKINDINNIPDTTYSAQIALGSGLRSIISASSGNSLSILNYTIVCSGASSFQILSGTGTPLTGSMFLSANGDVSSDLSDGPLTASINDNVYISSTNLVSGHISYRVV